MYEYKCEYVYADPSLVCGGNACVVIPQKELTNGFVPRAELKIMHIVKKRHGLNLNSTFEQRHCRSATVSDGDGDGDCGSGSHGKTSEKCSEGQSDDAEGENAGEKVKVGDGGVDDGKGG